MSEANKALLRRAVEARRLAMDSMNRTLPCFLACVVILSALPAWSGDKEKDDETIKNATAVLQDMLNSKTVPADLLEKADCVIVLPNVKKFGVGIGGSGGRGPISCRTGKNFDGK